MTVFTDHIQLANPVLKDRQTGDKQRNMILDQLFYMTFGDKKLGEEGHPETLTLL